MSPACPFGSRGCFQGGMVAPLRGSLGFRGKRRRVPHGVGQRQQVIGSGLLGGGRHCQPKHFPAAGNRQRIGVLLAEVVAVGLRVGGERAQDSSGVCVNVRQGGYRRLAAGRP